jgi:flagellar hook assembly protein FlgD
VGVQFVLARAVDVDLSVMDAIGRRVATLVAGPLAEGAHTVTWDGRGRDGRPAAAGVYVVRLEVGGEVLARTLAVVR